MPPRYAYWTILAGGLPTAFRAAEREDLLPTFKRIQEKHPDAEMKYFAKGKLWESKAAAYHAREDARPRSEEGFGSRKPSGFRDRREGERRESRGADWRPGGEHRDPRQPFRDAKKERNLERRKRRFEFNRRRQGFGGQERERQDREQPPREKPPGDSPSRANASDPSSFGETRRSPKGEGGPLRAEAQPEGARKRPVQRPFAGGTRKPSGFGSRKPSGFGGQKPSGFGKAQGAPSASRGAGSRKPGGRGPFKPRDRKS